MDQNYNINSNNDNNNNNNHDGWNEQTSNTNPYLFSNQNFVLNNSINQTPGGNNLIYQNVDHTNSTHQKLAHHDFIQQTPFNNNYINQNSTIPQNNFVDQNPIINNNNVLINQDLTNTVGIINHCLDNTFDNNFMGQSSHQDYIGANNFVNCNNNDQTLLINIASQLQNLQNVVNQILAIINIKQQQ